MATVRDMGNMGRRLLTVPTVAAAAFGLAISAPLWLPVVILADVVRGRFRLPMARLGAFAIGWAALETVGVAAATGLWVVGRGRSRRRHYRLQAWWARRLIDVLRATTGVRIDAPGAAVLRPGPVVMWCRHASLADSLVSAWVVTSLAGLRPRYVLKRELLADPCLDVVGHRLPNHFLDRQAVDATPELEALARLGAGMGVQDVAVIFPEGTRATPAKRVRSLERLGASDPARAERLAGLRHLLPPRPAGAASLVSGAEGADVVVAWHTGFDGLDTFGGILRALAGPPITVYFDARRYPRSEVPDPGRPGEPIDPRFVAWLDARWLDADRAVERLLGGAR